MLELCCGWACFYLLLCIQLLAAFDAKQCLKDVSAGREAEQAVDVSAGSFVQKGGRSRIRGREAKGDECKVLLDNILSPGLASVEGYISTEERFKFLA